MAEGWRRLKRIGNDDFEKFSQFFQNTRTVTLLEHKDEGS